MVHDNAKEEVHDWRHVLQQAEDGEGNHGCTVGKEQDWHDGDEAAANQQRVNSAADVAQRAVAMDFACNQHSQRGDKDNAKLQSHCLEEFQRRGALDETIDRHENCNADPQERKLAVRNGDNEDTNDGQGDGDALPYPQLFHEDDDGKEDTDDRVHEETQADFDQVRVVNAPEEEIPNAPQRPARDKVRRKGLGLQCGLSKRFSLDFPKEECEEQHKCPHDAVAHDLQRGNGLELLKVRRVHAIDDTHANRRYESNPGTHGQLKQWLR
ncbi:hypothetical protein AC1031_021923 [Aphanomyces cochlioides]|nr:hypothetical protein AC1031_021923 [Aphanomyces cochlioides]